jgi:glycosyl transferase family 25
MNYPNYIIHVKKGYEERERSIVEQFSRLNLPFEWIIDYDIDDLNQEVLDRYGYHGRKLGPAEISCSLKHIAAWERIAAGSRAGAFVFEDDVLIDIRRFKKLAAAAIKEFQAGNQKIGYISLGDGCAMYVPWTKTRKGQLLYPAEQVRATDSYWITRETAILRLAWIAAHGFCLPADHLINKIDNELGIPILWLAPTVVTQGSHTGRFASQIQVWDRGELREKVKWVMKKFRRKYLYPLLGVDLRPLEPTLRADLKLKLPGKDACSK